MASQSVFQQRTPSGSVRGSEEENIENVAMEGPTHHVQTHHLLFTVAVAP